MAILHVSGSYGAYGIAGGIAPIAMTTLVGSFDSTRSRAALNAGMTSAQSPAWSASVSDFWFHTVFYWTGTTTNNLPIIIFRSAANGNAEQVRVVRTTATTFRVEVWNGTAWITYGSSFTMASATLYRIDLHVKLHATAGEVTLFLNETAATTFTGAVVSNFGVVDHHILTTDSETALRAHSQTFVADASTINHYAATLTPTAAGFTSGWSGTFADVDEAVLDSEDFIHSNTLNAISTFVMTDLPGDAATKDILAVAVYASARANGGSAGDVQAVVRVDGTNYASADLNIVVGEGYTGAMALLTSNPQSSSPWLPAAVNAMEAGVKAVA